MTRGYPLSQTEVAIVKFSKNCQNCPKLSNCLTQRFQLVLFMFDCQNFSKIIKIIKICQQSQIVNTWIYTSELMRSKWGAGLCECLARLIQGAWEYGDVWVDIRQQFVGMASAGHTGESDSWLSCHPSNGPSPEHHLKFGVRVHPRAWPGANPG